MTREELVVVMQAHMKACIDSPVFFNEVLGKTYNLREADDPFVGELLVRFTFKPPKGNTQ